MNAQLCVRPGVYFAAVQGEGVIMDLIEDRYYGLCAQSTALWQRLLEGKLLESPPISQAVSPDIIAQQLEAWRQTKLVIDRAARPPIANVLPVLKTIGAPAAVGLDPARIGASPYSILGFLHLLRAAGWSRRVMKRRGICWTLKRLQQIPVSATQQPEHVEAIVHRVMRVYCSSRQRWNRRSKDDCLPRSLALVVALRRLGVDAEICFGVLKFPFAAHAWVEAGGRVINETPENVRQYTLLARF
jgi:hypothetical protein